MGFFRNSVTSYDVSLKETRERISNDMHVLVQFTLRFRALLVVISQKETHHKTSGGAVGFLPLPRTRADWQSDVS